MRIKNVAARHHAWKGVMLFMLALPLWTAFGRQVPLRVLSALPTQDERFSSASLERVAILTTQTKDGRAAISRNGVNPQATHCRPSVVGIYLLGMFSLMVRLAA